MRKSATQETKDVERVLGRCYVLLLGPDVQKEYRSDNPDRHSEQPDKVNHTPRTEGQKGRLLKSENNSFPLLATPSNPKKQE